MQETKWGSLTEVWQSIYVDIKNDKIRAIFNQYDFDNITEQELNYWERRGLKPDYMYDLAEEGWEKKLGLLQTV